MEKKGINFWSCTTFAVALLFGNWLMQSGDLHFFREPANIYEDDSVKDELNLEILLEVVKTNDLRSIEQTLQHLNKTHLSYLENHTFAFNSRSLHESSYDNPRAIVYGQSADFLMTFNGDPAQNSFDKLEVAQFSSVKKNYDFFEISFRNTPNSAGSYLDISDSGGPEGVCLGCHVNGKPIWDTYDIWPGIYGSVDGEPIRPTQKFLPSLLAFSGKEYLKGEKAKWDHFTTLRKTHGRYQWLPAPVTVNQNGIDRIRLPSGGPFIPNTALSVALTRKNSERIIELIKSSKDKISREVYLEILFSLDCRGTKEESIKAIVQKLETKYKDQLQTIQSDLKGRMVSVLLRYAEAPYFNPDMLVDYFYFSNFRKPDSAKDYTFKGAAENNFSEKIAKVHRCMQGNEAAGIRNDYDLTENRLDYKGCIKEHSPNLFEGLVLKNIFEWAVEVGMVSSKTHVVPIARAAAILDGNGIDAKTDMWSTLQFGEHDYSSGSGIEIRLFRNGFVDLFESNPIRGDRNSFGEYLLSKDGHFLNSDETLRYCQGLVKKLNSFEK